MKIPEPRLGPGRAPFWDPFLPKPLIKHAQNCISGVKMGRRKADCAQTPYKTCSKLHFGGSKWVTQKPT